ncbi:MAG: DMT family transporter [Candidatus Devosia phytovorans]|uniref:DMT family transporter n=1 Tax=Candidatus Devosia phytovorans TaxID=3121372 RepID=A0AAJ5VUX2_9HYPH|nr:DMT family transporter [Devosia sp.]WEK05264.1 MAG: DMT family transporter [Devosia sp.]
MTLFIAYAIAAGILVGLSRQLNGRLALSTSPLIASFFNHAVGFVFLTGLGLILGNLFLPGAANTPWWAWLGGPVGVIFVASGSWLIARIGAINTAMLVIGGQMVSGVALDLFRGAPLTLWACALGVVLILAGMALTQKR